MEKVNKLTRLLNSEKIDGYIIPKNDEFFGVVVPENRFCEGVTKRSGPPGNQDRRIIEHELSHFRFHKIIGWLVDLWF